MSWFSSASGEGFWESISIPCLSHLGIDPGRFQELLVENGQLLETVASSASLSFFSEFGDLTFIIALLLSATKNGRFKVYSGALFANILMVFISAFIGNCLSAIPDNVGRITSASLFYFYGIRMLLDAIRGNSSEERFEDEVKDAKGAINTRRKASKGASGAAAGVTSGIFALAFSLTFFGEFGDRSQVITLTMAAREDMTGVIVGCILGQAICLLIAVCVGKALAQKLSYNKASTFGGILFILCGTRSLSPYIPELI